MHTVTALLERLKTLSADERHAEMQALAAFPPAEAVEWALALLEGLEAEHGPLVGMACAQIVARSGDSAHLDRLRAARAGLPAMPGWRDWRQEVGHAQRMLETRARGECECAAVRSDNYPPTNDRFETIEETLGDWEAELSVRCRACGRTYRVVRDDGYHYPVFRWR